METLSEEALVEEEVEWLLRSMGMSGKHAGFAYLIAMIAEVVREPDKLQLITRKLYPDMAVRFQVPSSRIERNVRTIINSYWGKGDHTRLDTIAGRRVVNRPTNSESIDLVASYIRRHR